MSITTDHFRRAEIFRRPVRCHWAGFESDTYRMQREGWEFAVEHIRQIVLMADAYRVTARHARAGWVFWGQVQGFKIGHEDPFEHAEIVFEHCVPDHHKLVIGGAPVYGVMQRVDMAVSFDDYVVSRKTLAEMGIFKPWTEPEPRAIITRPEQVAELLEKISKLQEPELQAIYERNRLRDLRDRVPELTHATILSIAA